MHIDSFIRISAAVIMEVFLWTFWTFTRSDANIHLIFVEPSSEPKKKCLHKPLCYSIDPKSRVCQILSPQI